MNKIVHSTIDHPLAFFESLIIRRLTTQIHADFKDLCVQQGGYFMPVHPYNGLNNEEVFFVDIGKPEDMNVSSYSFHDYVSGRLRLEFNLAITNFDKHYFSLESLHQGQFCKSMSATIDSLLTLLDNDNKFYDQRIKDILLELKKHVHHKSEEVNVPDEFGTEITANNVFEFKLNNKRSIVRDLYNVLENLHFFDENFDQFQTFYQVLTSETIIHNTQLKVFCSNYKAAYIFRKIEPLFHKLSFSTIGEANIFYNKQGKAFKENDLYKALSKFKREYVNNPDLIADIDELINTLL